MQVLVPVKVSALAKSRLSAVLDLEGRVRLVIWMLDRVLRAVAGVSTGGLFVVGGDARIVLVARRYGASLLAEEGTDLNTTLFRAMATVRRPALPACMLLAADLPCLTRDDVEALIEASRGGQAAVIAPAEGGEGTNALIVPAGCVLEPAFGPASRARHTLLFARQGFHVSEVRRSGLAFDVDLPVHLARVRSAIPIGELSL